ncbi:MAG: hypothetical protein ABSA52_21725 [Candidatus Binatia bacterium]|jgi:hypothetical protein
MIRAKAKGTRNEHRSRRLRGPTVPPRLWDLVGVSATDVVLCQVKTRDWPGTAEMETLKEFPAPPNARKLVHRWRDRQRTPDVQQL